LAQTALVLFIYRGVKKLNSTAAELETRVTPIIDKVGPLVDQVQGTVTTVKTTVDKISVHAKDTFEKVTVETRAVASAIAATSQEITNLAMHQAEQFSGTLDQTSTALQRQVTDLERLMARTQRRIEDTTIEVQSTVLDPIREVSALLVGLKRLIETLLPRHRKQIDKAYQDEEMFI
jgi:ABC-type transporter Mla subunit MlaD